MKFRIVGLILIINSEILFAQAPVVENVRFIQRTDGTLLVDIYYDVTNVDGDTVDIVIEASNDGGVTCDLPCTSLTGDIGVGITQGINKHVVWDFYADNPNTSSNSYRVRVTAHEIVTDIDGNRYLYVTIGNQIWMAENLKTTHYRNGDEIPNVTDDVEWSTLSTGAYRNYENNKDSVDTYGRLYNWHSLNDSRNIAPEGWHVPSDEDWKELEMALGMNQESADGTGFRGAGVGGKLKETGTDHWESPNTGATNESGFSALPGGYCSTSGNFNNMGNEGCFWSSTESSSSSWFRALKYDFSEVNRNTLNKEYGFSVRCVKESDILITALESLGNAENLYHSVCESQGREAAVASSLDLLDSHELVSSASMASDSTITVFYVNGLQGCVGYPDVYTPIESVFSMKKEQDISDGVVNQSGGGVNPSGGEVIPSAVILIPAANEFGSTLENDVKELLDKCFGSLVPKTQVYMNEKVDVPLISDILKAGPGVLVWSGHGWIVKKEPDIPDEWCAFMTGQGYPTDIAAEVYEEFCEKYWGVENDRTIAVKPWKGLYYLLVTPAFICANAEFDKTSGGNKNCNKSLVFANCCYSAESNMMNAFKVTNADIYLGWDKGVHPDFSGIMLKEFFKSATDTFTVLEAYQPLWHVKDPEEPHAELNMDPCDDNSNLAMMIRSNMNMTIDGTDVWGYQVGRTVAGGCTFMTCVSEPGQGSLYVISVSFPGVSTGSFDCTTSDAAMSVFNASSGKVFIVDDGLAGVSGNIDVKRSNSNIVSGTFSGTLGYWPQGETSDFPSETLEIGEGFFKYSKSQ